MPTSRKPSALCRARLAPFSGKMPACSVQSPPARALAMTLRAAPGRRRGRGPARRRRRSPRRRRGRRRGASTGRARTSRRPLRRARRRAGARRGAPRPTPPSRDALSRRSRARSRSPPRRSPPPRASPTRAAGGCARRDSIGRRGRGQPLRRRLDRRHRGAWLSEPGAAARAGTRCREARRHGLPDRAGAAHLPLSLALRRGGVADRARRHGGGPDARRDARALPGARARVPDRPGRGPRRPLHRRPPPPAS